MKIVTILSYKLSLSIGVKKKKNRKLIFLRP